MVASHETLTAAAVAGDAELFVSFLSGREREWAEAQERLVRRGNYLDRASFGLAPAVAPLSPTVILSPDLLSAELVTQAAYALDVGNGLTETVTLEQRAVFRQGADRWLLAPPDEVFWGGTAATGGRYLRLSYPIRDATIAERLARELDAALAEFCRDVGDNCAHIILVLSTSPASFIAYNRPEALWSGGSEIVMPTPTLAGRPLDDAGYRALYRVYATRVVGAAAANAAGWQCCDDAVFYGALLDAQLSRLGLRPWPLTTNDYRQLAVAPDTLDNLQRLWRASETTPEQRRAVYALVEFLVARRATLHDDPTIVDMQRFLLDGVDRSFWEWLSGVTSDAYGSPEMFERDFLGFLAERSDDALFLTLSQRERG